VAVAAAREIYPSLSASHFHGDVIFDLGLGAYRWADVIVAGLDNREARLHVNRCCYKVDRPWIDAATEVLQGIVRTFVPDGPCYECTMTSADWTVLKERRGCAGLRLEGVPAERVPTTPITASIIGALQCQEALKLIHGMDGLAGKGAVFNGLSNDFYTFPYHLNEECNSHDPFAEVISLNESVSDYTPRKLLARAQEKLGDGAVLELTHELLLAFECSRCSEKQPIYEPLARVSERDATCPNCGEMRRPLSTKTIYGNEDFLDLPFTNLGVPLFDILTARLGMTTVGFEFAGDAQTVLGELCADKAKTARRPS
jgi:adenylyltransferase/sulfurtransferase